MTSSSCVASRSPIEAAIAADPAILARLEKRIEVVLTRGDAPLSVGDFALAHCIGRRGGQLIQALEGRVPGIT